MRLTAVFRLKHQKVRASPTSLSRTSVFFLFGFSVRHWVDDSTLSFCLFFFSFCGEEEKVWVDKEEDIYYVRYVAFCIKFKESLPNLLPFCV